MPVPLPRDFPRCGKVPLVFSTPWKIRPVFFHTVEKSFPYCGKLSGKFSMLWKNPQKVFHGVENIGIDFIKCGLFSCDGEYSVAAESDRDGVVPAPNSH
jgi:hypothetical protein